MGQKSDPRRTKIEDKNEVEKKALEDRLGAVLGRSWVVLGAVLGQLGPHFRAVAAVALVFFLSSILKK